MVNQSTKHCTAFAGNHLIASGDLTKVVVKVKQTIHRGEHAPVLIFDDRTSELVEVDLRGSVEDVLSRLARSTGTDRSDDDETQLQTSSNRGPGRPKLGVVAREVTLLPRHWEWLNCQPGGASVTLRRLVETAKRANVEKDRARIAQEATYKFIAAMAGDLPGFEDATRALFAKNKDRLKQFERQISGWPCDVRKHALQLMKETISLEKTIPDE
jgi:hypothetical protein